MSERVPFSTHGFAVVVCRNFDGKWLAVKETRNRGWWLPAGLVDPGEDFIQAAHRECFEEAFVRIVIKGVLRVEHSVYAPTHARMRVIFFAEPIDSNQMPKTIADKESEEARWVTLEELKILAKKMPGLRGPELYEWGSYIEKGGSVAPVHFLCREDENVPLTLSAVTQGAPGKEFHEFIEAVEQGNEKLVKKQLLAGFNCNSKINSKDWTPLHLACHANQENILVLLLLSGASIEAKTHKNRTVIHFAAQSTPQILLSVLLGIYQFENPADIVNSKDNDGDTALHFAASMSGKGFIWNLLIENGADPNIPNNKGLTALDIVSNE